MDHGPESVFLQSNVNKLGNTNSKTQNKRNKKLFTNVIWFKTHTENGSTNRTIQFEIIFLCTKCGKVKPTHKKQQGLER